MSDYTLTNLKEIDDAQAENPDMELRFGRKHLGSEHLGISYVRYAPGFRSAGHHHREQEEAYIVVAGSGRMKLDDEIVELRQWDVVRVAPATIRATEAGADGIEIVAVGSDRPEGGGGTPIKDWWTD